MRTSRAANPGNAENPAPGVGFSAVKRDGLDNRPGEPERQEGWQ